MEKRSREDIELNVVVDRRQPSRDGEPIHRGIEVWEFDGICWGSAVEVVLAARLAGLIVGSFSLRHDADEWEVFCDLLLLMFCVSKFDVSGDQLEYSCLTLNHEFMMRFVPALIRHQGIKELPRMQN